jgi:hypothetical protein
MSYRSWFAKLPSAWKTGRPGQWPERRVVSRARLRVEPLEDRMLLSSTFTVTNTNDSGPGSLRAAITQVNQDTQPGTDTITFAIGSGAQTIVPLTALPTITHPVVIDGTTQPGYAGTPLIQLDGASAGYTYGLTVAGGNSTVEGLVINRFTEGEIYLTGIGGDTVAGNYIGTNSTGTAGFASNAQGIDGVLVNSTANNNVIGGTTAAARNVISGNHIGINAYSQGNLIEGNYIGTDVTGTQAVANTQGVILNNAYNTLGGTAAGAGNLISGNTYDVHLTGSQNVVEGNLIGTDCTGMHLLAGAAPPANDFGFYYPAANNTIGGTAPGAANVIAGCLSAVYPAGAIQDFQGNYFGTDAIGTGALGIFEGVDGNKGWTASLSSAVSSSSGITIAGSFASAASTTYTVKFYSSPSGTSQSQTYLGSITVTTDATGKATFTATLPITVAKGQLITATATDPLGNTSEFSGSQVVS